MELVLWEALVSRLDIYIACGFELHSFLSTDLNPLSASHVAPRLICGRVYKHLDKKMEFLWTGDLSINTVHVEDVSRAIWHTANWYVNNGKQGTVVFNLADSNNTGRLLLSFQLELMRWARTVNTIGRPNSLTMVERAVGLLMHGNELDQGAVNTHISAIFGIETGFQGTLISKMAKVQD